MLTVCYEWFQNHMTLDQSFARNALTWTTSKIPNYRHKSPVINLLLSIANTMVFNAWLMVIVNYKFLKPFSKAWWFQRVGTVHKVRHARGGRGPRMCDSL